MSTPKPKLSVMPPPEQADWQKDLICFPNSFTPRGNTANALHALMRAPEWRDVLWYDSFRHRIMLDREPPWEGSVGNRRLTDEDAIETSIWMQHQGIEISGKTAWDALIVAAQKNSRNPLQEDLESLEWDGVPRINTWLHDYFGVDNTELNRNIGRCWLISAIARAFQPGVQADHCIVFEGRQGLGKSTAIKRLTGEQYFAVHVAQSLVNKEAAILCEGVWIMEFSELSSIKGNRSEDVKSFLSRTHDRYRSIYGKQATDFPRQCVFAGTTNEDVYLDDSTGGRRYWPVYCRRVDLEDLSDVRDMLWAEALVAYRSGERWHLSRQMEHQAQVVQRQRLIEEPWNATVLKHITGKTSVSANEILLDMSIKISDINSGHQRRVAKCLRLHGWVQRNTPGGECLRRWYPPVKNHKPTPFFS